MKTGTRKVHAHLSAIAVLIALIGMCLLGGGPQAGALSGLSQPTSTPVMPQSGNLVYEEPSPLDVAGVPVQADAGSLVDEESLESEAYLKQALAGVSFSMPGQSAKVPLDSADRAAQDDVWCTQVILNTQLDVTEFGDGTGSIDYWSIIRQNVYYSKLNYASANYSLVIEDDPAYDSDVYSSTLDIDVFGQSFMAPYGLVTMTVTYSRDYAGTADIDDYAFYEVWTLDDYGYLDAWVTGWIPGESPTGWSYGRMGSSTDPARLATLSGQPGMLVFGMWSDRDSAHETWYFDDIELELCFRVGSERVYLPVLRRETGIAGCVPFEPDSAAARGSTVVGATCSGSFGAGDIKDYYSLDLGGETHAVLSLTNLPAGTNWDALIYEDKGGGSYGLACQIGTIGSQDKSAACPNKPGYTSFSGSDDYFVLVSAGTAPGSGSNTYQMSVTAP